VCGTRPSASVTVPCQPCSKARDRLSMAELLQAVRQRATSPRNAAPRHGAFRLSSSVSLRPESDRLKTEYQNDVRQDITEYQPEPPFPRPWAHGSGQSTHRASGTCDLWSPAMGCGWRTGIRDSDFSASLPERYNRRDPLPSGNLAHVTTQGAPARTEAIGSPIDRILPPGQGARGPGLVQHYPATRPSSVVEAVSSMAPYPRQPPRAGLPL
jgi:hypothetical protein